MEADNDVFVLWDVLDRLFVSYVLFGEYRLLRRDLELFCFLYSGHHSQLLLYLLA